FRQPHSETLEPPAEELRALRQARRFRNGAGTGTQRSLWIWLLAKLAIEDLGCDLISEDLRGAARNREHARISHHPLQGIPTRVAGRSEHLQSIVGDL